MNPKGIRTDMKKVIICIVIIGLLTGGFYLFRSWAGGLAGGGESEHIVPDTAKTGEPVTIGLILNTWGKHTKSISERYTNISLYYKLAGENSYKSVQPTLVDLPANYKAAISDMAQYEKYEFTIPAYSKGTMGEIEYYIDLTFDGYPSHTEGIKKIQLIN